MKIQIVLEPETQSDTDWIKKQEATPVNWTKQTNQQFTITQNLFNASGIFRSISFGCVNKSVRFFLLDQPNHIYEQPSISRQSAP